ncbi:MAG TPA: sigma-70 family RNA polymerase sigma factor [Verrucomicrobiales bacterium]|jgi:RNA polymerase sigma factor (sigma-70 family)|nr:sigma-70 family RNA polymerase sigma factor [Verrucomicrobiales bacterium]
MKTVNPPVMESDAQLLDRYVTHRDEAAFRQIVERHAGMVLGVARRRTGDAVLGEEAGQIVFTLLARKAPALRHLPPEKLGGWLHRTALLTAGNLLRSEMRRRLHHERFASDAARTATGTDDSPWLAALPFVDEAIDSLSEADRQLVVQHFYQRRTFRELSTGTGRTEDAVRKRAGRVLERLSAFFKRRGIALSAGALMSGLSARVTEAAPSGYATATAAAAVGKASSLKTLTVISNTLATMALTKLTVTAAAVAFFLPLGLHWSGSASVPPSAAPPALPAALKETKYADTRPAGRGPVSPSAAGAARSAAFVRFARELAKVTPPPADEQRLVELQRLAFELPAAELAPAFQLLRTAPGGNALKPVVTAVAARWAESAPAEAMRMAATLPKELQASAWSGVLPVWGRRDFNAAFAWTCAQPPGLEREGQMDIVYSDLMKRDPASALARLQEVPIEGKRKQYRLWTLEVWRNADPDAALSWINTNEPAETRDMRVNQFISDWAGNRPDLAVAYALKMVADPRDRESTVRFALMQWGMHDPAAAISALTNLPPELRTVNLARNAGPFIANGDLPAFLEAVHGMPAGEFRDALHVPVVQRVAATDPAKAQELAAGITAPECRREAADAIGRQWLRNDPAAARRWIEASPDLTASDKKQLLTEHTK